MNYYVIPLTPDGEEAGNFGPYGKDEADEKASACLHGAIIIAQRKGD